MKAKKVKATVKPLASNTTDIEECASVQGVRVVGGPKGIIIEKIQLGTKIKSPKVAKAKPVVKKTVKPSAAKPKK